MIKKTHWNNCMAAERRFSYQSKWKKKKKKTFNNTNSHIILICDGLIFGWWRAAVCACECIGRVRLGREVCVSRFGLTRCHCVLMGQPALTATSLARPTYVWTKQLMRSTAQCRLDTSTKWKRNGKYCFQMKTKVCQDSRICFVFFNFFLLPNEIAMR